MSIPILELPVILTSLALQSAATPAPHRCSTPPAAVADCCVHSTTLAAAASPQAISPSAQTAKADERTRSDVDDR